MQSISVLGCLATNWKRDAEIQFLVKNPDIKEKVKSVVKSKLVCN